MASLKTVLLLARPMLSLAVSFSALAAQVYFSHALTLATLALSAGVFLLSAAASALNQYQERAADGRMERTKDRPLPAKKIAPQWVLLLSGIAFVAGFLILWLGTNLLSAGIGVVTLGGYNFLYTPLKKRTPIALLIGAIIGALPVLIGCAAATGHIEITAVYIALFVFFWQVPHFLLLLLQYNKDYDRAEFSTLLSVLTPERIRILTVVWLLAASGVTALFPLIGIITNGWLVAALLLLNVFTIAGFALPLFGKSGLAFSGSLYVFQGAVLGALILQGMMRG